MASIICEKCRLALEAGDDGTNTYDIEDWANGCEHQANGTRRSRFPRPRQNNSSVRPTAIAEALQDTEVYNTVPVKCEA